MEELVKEQHQCNLRIDFKIVNNCFAVHCVMHSLTLASVRSVVPVSRSALFAVRPVDSGLTGALTALRVTRLDESCRGVAVTLTAAGARLETKGAVLRGETDSG